MRFKGFLVAAALMGLMATAARANTVTLSDLLVTGATIQSGDKLFSNFTYSKTGSGMPAATAINVIPVGTGVGTDYFGVRFQGGFSDLDISDTAADALIGYQVTVLDPSMVITDAHMASNVDATDGDVFAEVDETFSVDNFNTALSETVANASVHNGTQILSATTVFGAGYKHLYVLKDIQINWTGGVPPTMSFVDQTFSQGVVPLPAAAWASFGMLGLLGLVRMRKAWR